MTSNPYKSFSLVCAILLASTGIALWHFTNIHPLWIYLISISLITFLLYAYDKFQARNNRQRIPEMILHLLALIGGSPGALVGQMIFRHKTKKYRFLIVFVMIVILQIVLIIAWVGRHEGWSKITDVVHISVSKPFEHYSESPSSYAFSNSALSSVISPFS